MKRKRRLEDLINTLDKTIAAVDGGAMAKKDMFQGFVWKAIKEHQRKYSAEARRKYGDAIVDAAEKEVNAYSQDERFTANIDKYKAGLAAFLREAMHIYYDNLTDGS